MCTFACEYNKNTPVCVPDFMMMHSNINNECFDDVFDIAVFVPCQAADITEKQDESESERNGFHVEGERVRGQGHQHRHELHRD